jgi:hypothetical protein
MKLNYSTPSQRNTTRSAPFLRVRENQATLLRATFPHYVRENQPFEEITTKREKTTDWMAERVGFEPTVEFPQHTLSKRAP